MSKYKEALERARKYYKETTNDVYNYKDMLEQIFPDIEESEDKKIKEEIINYFQCQSRDEPCRKHIHDKWITWLEKQEGCECIKKDWLEHIKQSWYKEGFIDGKYSTSKEWTKNDAATLKELIDFLENGTAKLQHDLTRYANWLKIQLTPIKKQGEQKLPIEKLPEEMKSIGESLGFTTQEECDEYNQMVSDLIMSDEDKSEQKATNKIEPKFKVGDIIRHKEQGFTCKIIAVDTEYRLSECMGTHLPFESQDAYELVEQKPADKVEPFDKYEGLTDFERTLADICIGWIGQELGWKQYIKDNADVLLKIAVKKFNSVQDAPFEQKTAWSEEELTDFEKSLKHIIEEAIECGDTHNLKADADMLLRLVQKPAWSEEDENNIDTIISVYHPSPKIVNWLKSLKQRYTWKPSDEQMKALDSVIDEYDGYPEFDSLVSLKNDLSKL